MPFKLFRKLVGLPKAYFFGGALKLKHILILLLCLFFVGCKASDLADSSKTDERAQPDEYHRREKGGYWHGEGLKDPIRYCTDCHGSDLKGGDGPSCYNCHGVNWGEDKH
ncbi:MAG: hypothetical protein A2527_05590 [Candidatus Lambdaproteobacteria bacterium RIFOXYD2_FULL_50_16]|uniref:Uncharacterized protein n=1 Tax=Candidatus Lambdaproteobacteria bacterium RIFOXYD2_FULL_50_16 TaxID=1817772 RepID=A0A1F6G964_9PROT|nr:MAG: hypothetical protein A2527_05590 [Candidatus Lambdaproteobacteria bacterium RIFOXYD2_FULL_50_16]